MTFAQPDYDTFECLKACKNALRKGGTSPAIANGANEVANALFREGKISFLRIGELVSAAVENIHPSELNTLEDVLKADKTAREFVLSSI